MESKILEDGVSFIEPIFSVGVSCFVYKDDPENEILKHILKIKEQDPAGISLSNEGGWQSNDVDRENSPPCINKLTQYVSDCVGNYALKAGFKPGTGLAGNMWYNVNGKYSFNYTHTHPQALFSAVYYVDVPEGDSGNLALMNSNGITDYTAAYMFDISKMNSFSASSYEIKPQNNLLIIFPSWVPHLVKPNYTEKNRVSIAFNFTPVGYEIEGKKKIHPGKI
jgi:uncharacterized protein (TIGR02466 family)